MSPEVINGLFGLGGAALGAIVAGLFSWWQHSKTKDRKEVSIYSSRPSNLIAVDSSIAEMVKITVSNHEVPTVFTFDVTVANTGNQTLNGLAIPVATDVDGRLLGADVASANFDDQTGCSVALDGEKNLKIEIAYLNPGDEYVARVLVSDEPKTITPSFRQREVSAKIKTNHESGVPDVLARAMLDALARNSILDLSMKVSSPQYRRWRESDSDR